MSNDTRHLYVARLIGTDGVRQVLELMATDDKSAWEEANDGIDPLLGLWVEVKRKDDPQQQLDLA